MCACACVRVRECVSLRVHVCAHVCMWVRAPIYEKVLFDGGSPTPDKVKQNLNTVFTHTQDLWQANKLVESTMKKKKNESTMKKGK